MLLVSLTRATFRRAEFGFLGVMVRTWVHTPRFCGDPFAPRTIRPFSALYVKRRAGALFFLAIFFRPFRTSWLMVGKLSPYRRFVIYRRFLITVIDQKPSS